MSEIFEVILHYICRTVGMLVFWTFSLGKVTGMRPSKGFRKAGIFVRTKDGWIVHEDVAALVGLLAIVGLVLLVALT